MGGALAVGIGGEERRGGAARRPKGAGAVGGGAQTAAGEPAASRRSPPPLELKRLYPRPRPMTPLEDPKVRLRSVEEPGPEPRSLRLAALAQSSASSLVFTALAWRSTWSTRRPSGELVKTLPGPVFLERVLERHHRIELLRRRIGFHRHCQTRKDEGKLTMAKKR